MSRYAGKVAWFNNAEGYGFLKAEGDKDILRQLGATQNDFFTPLREPEPVQFDVALGEKQSHASSAQKPRILVAAHDRAVQESRVAILRSQGYIVESVGTDDEAMALLDMERFALVVIGRDAPAPTPHLDQRLRELYPAMPILKIDRGSSVSNYASRTVAPDPYEVLAAVRDMLAS